MDKTLTIRNSTAEFLIFQLENREDGVQLLYSDETLWLTQDAISLLFDKGRSTIAEHLQNIFVSGELVEDSVCRKFRQTAADGKNYQVKYYNLDAVISVGYRVNSVRATQFRQWCTNILRQFAIQGYVIDKQRMENGTFLNIDYFEQLLDEIREIRLSERRFYQKITDIYATAILQVNLLSNEPVLRRSIWALPLGLNLHGAGFLSPMSPLRRTTSKGMN